MRTTLVLDDYLFAKARALTGVNEKTLLVREALKALIERESARRLARLGGSEPALKPLPAEGRKPSDSGRQSITGSVWLRHLGCKINPGRFSGS